MWLLSWRELPYHSFLDCRMIGYVLVLVSSSSNHSFGFWQRCKIENGDILEAWILWKHFFRNLSLFSPETEFDKPRKVVIQLGLLRPYIGIGLKNSDFPIPQLGWRKRNLEINEIQNGKRDATAIQLFKKSCTQTGTEHCISFPSHSNVNNSIFVPF